ncbi:MAG: hypothetical protein Q8O31_01495 [Rhodocyclaceae bacterium]|nr:hypothetical protein [Rhodocyclaceae bacterium]
MCNQQVKRCVHTVALKGRETVMSAIWHVTHYKPHRASKTEDKGVVMKFVVCLSREGFGEFSTNDLTLGRLYEIFAPPDSHGMLRIIDDSGEDYLYPASFFESVEIQMPAANRLHALLAA